MHALIYNVVVFMTVGVYVVMWTYDVSSLFLHSSLQIIS
jgi:hypothetical protein